MRAIAAALLGLLGGCATMHSANGTTITDFRDTKIRARVVAEHLMAQWVANSGDDSSISLGPLEAVDRSIKAGGYRAAMASFWLDTINRLRDSEMRKAGPAMMREVASWPQATQDAAFRLFFFQIAALLTKQLAPKPRSEGNYSYFFTQVYRDADDKAVCASLVSAPKRWDAAHPNGPIFDFSQDGINVVQRGIVNRCPGLRERWPGSDYAKGGRLYDPTRMLPEPNYVD